MTPDQRRESILDAVIPLVLASGSDLSTREIAAASGVAEGTIFRVFESKSDLIDAATRRAFTPSALLADLASLEPADQGVRAPLGDLVQRIVTTLQEHAQSTHRLVALLPRSDGHDPLPGLPDPIRHELSQAIVVGVQRLLSPYSSELGASAEASAGAIVALSFGSALAEPASAASDVARIALHGITRTDGGPSC